MKILILLKKYEGGVGSVIKYISKDFGRSGHKVKIISREDDLKIYSLRKSIFLIRRLIKKMMDEKDYDIIYTQDWSLAFPLLFPIPMFNKKHFCVFYGTDVAMGRLFQSVVGYKMKKRLIVCNDELKKRFPKSNLVYNRVDINKFKPSNRVKRIRNSVGFANWATDEYHYNEIKKAVNNIGKRFIVAEGVPKEKMPDFYRKIETFISLPPSYAGFGLVYLEAMASGVPKIIGNNHGGGEILPVTKIEDYKSIKEAIVNAKKKNYRTWILDNKFTWEEAVKKMEKIFLAER